VVKIKLKEELDIKMAERENILKKMNALQTELIQKEGVIFYLREKIAIENAKLEKSKTEE
jgi:hypothetical protein